jgi:hypothetical protein
MQWWASIISSSSLTTSRWIYPQLGLRVIRKVENDGTRLAQLRSERLFERHITVLPNGVADELWININNVSIH